MNEILEGIKVLCFAGSYLVALSLGVWHYFRPRPIYRLVEIGFGCAGLLAHTIYVMVQPLPLATSQGSLLFLAWILTVFYLYGSLHHHRLAWGLFVLPVVLGLIILAVLFPGATPSHSQGFILDLAASIQGQRFWGMVHGWLLFLAAVGICVGFVASLMYLVQMYRLRAKVPPTHGLRLLSLERLEAMNRRAVITAFPLLTAGLLVGLALQWQHGLFLQGWDSPRIFSTVVLWLVFAILLYLRYGIRRRGKQVAFLTMLAFALLLFALASPVHPFLQ